jgi:hypothetical protein
MKILHREYTTDAMVWARRGDLRARLALALWAVRWQQAEIRSMQHERAAQIRLMESRRRVAQYVQVGAESATGMLTTTC